MAPESTNTARWLVVNGRPWATVHEAALYLKVSDKTIRAQIRSGKIPAHRLGPTLIRIDLDELDAALQLRIAPTTRLGKS